MVKKNETNTEALTIIEGSSLVETAGKFDPRELVADGFRTTVRVKLEEGQWFSRDGEAVYTGLRQPVEMLNEDTGEVKSITVHGFSYKGADVEMLGDGGLNSSLKSVTPYSKVKIFRGGQIEISKGRRMNQYIVSAKATAASDKYQAEREAARLAEEVKAPSKRSNSDNRATA